ncbi:hypothetical protein EJB05_21971, partial [Eragrostis curvula]
MHEVTLFLFSHYKIRTHGVFVTSRSGSTQSVQTLESVVEGRVAKDEHEVARERERAEHHKKEDE